jgi:hypothetical protein
LVFNRMKQLGNEGSSRVTKGNVRNKSARILCRHFVRSSNGQMWTDTCSSETERNVRSSRIKGRTRSLELLDNQGVEGGWSLVGRWLEVLIRYRDFSEQRRRTAWNLMPTFTIKETVLLDRIRSEFTTKENGIKITSRKLISPIVFLILKILNFNTSIAVFFLYIHKKIYLFEYIRN